MDVELQPDLLTRELPFSVGLRLSAVGLLLYAEVTVAYLRAVDADHPHPLVAAVEVHVNGVAVGDGGDGGLERADPGLGWCGRWLLRLGEDLGGGLLLNRLPFVWGGLRQCSR